MKHFREDQHRFIYGVHHWCRDDKGNKLDDDKKMHIILNHYNLDEAALTANDKTFLKGGSKLKARLVKSTGPHAERERWFFEPKVMEALRRYESGLRGPP